MKVKDVMTTPVVTVQSGASLLEALNLMVDHRMSGLPVVDEIGQLCGIVSEGDLLRRVELGTAERRDSWWSRLLSGVGAADAYCVANGRRVSDVMSRAPLTVDEDMRLADAATEMEENRIKRLPVTRDGDLVGMLTRADFVKALRRYVGPAYEDQATSDEEIRARILGEINAQPWAKDGPISVGVAGGRVTLDGTVGSASCRRAAGVAAETVAGVLAIENRIEVLDAVALPLF